MDLNEHENYTYEHLLIVLVLGCIQGYGLDLKDIRVIKDLLEILVLKVLQVLQDAQDLQALLDPLETLDLKVTQDLQVHQS
jgi:hypothetical protein